MFRKSKLRNDPALASAIVTSDSVKKQKKGGNTTSALNSAAKPVLPYMPSTPNRKFQLPHFGSLSKPRLIAYGVIAFVFGAPILFFLILKLGDISLPSSSHAVCKGGIIIDASKYIAANDITKTGQVADKVTKLKNHESDANCEYILVRYAIMTGNYSEAQKQLDQLNKDYNYRYDEGFGDHPLQPQELQQIITESIAAQNETNAQAAENSKEQAELDQSADKLVGGKQ